MSMIGDLLEDDSTERIADMAVHVSNLRRENEALRRQRDRYRSEAERARVGQRPMAQVLVGRSR